MKKLMMYAFIAMAAAAAVPLYAQETDEITQVISDVDTQTNTDEQATSLSPEEIRILEAVFKTEETD